MTTSVDALYASFSAILALLKEKGEVSLESELSRNFAKALLLASASYFERRMCDEVEGFVKESANGNLAVCALVRTKAITRQYHTWFKWDVANANAFFAMFGQDFKDAMQKRVAADDALRSSISSFMTIGAERNRLVHSDFASFDLTSTADEVFGKYQDALGFVDQVGALLRN